MPYHYHGNIRAVVTAEKFIEFGAAAIELPVWRFDVDRVFAETIRGFPGTARDLLTCTYRCAAKRMRKCSKSGRCARVAIVPASGDGLHEPIEFTS